MVLNMGVLKYKLKSSKSFDYRYFTRYYTRLNENVANLKLINDICKLKEQTLRQHGQSKQFPMFQKVFCLWTDFLLAIRDQK